MNPIDIPHKMLSQDPFSQWLGIEILECELGRCKVGMKVRPEMLNGMKKAHGGITFSLADTCFAFSTNTLGKLAVSIEASVNHIEAIEEGDYITAESTIDKQKSRLGFNIIEVKKGDEIIALFKGVAHRTNIDWKES